jgi:hypothetical protein
MSQNRSDLDSALRLPHPAFLVPPSALPESFRLSPTVRDNEQKLRTERLAQPSRGVLRRDFRRPRLSRIAIPGRYKGRHGDSPDERRESEGRGGEWVVARAGLTASPGGGKTADPSTDSARSAPGSRGRDPSRARQRERWDGMRTCEVAPGDALLTQAFARPTFKEVTRK